MLQRLGADSSGELLHLFLNVGKEGVRASAANQPGGVEGLLGEVDKHGETSVHGMEPDVVGGESKYILCSA